jgi:hypothetical protein
MMNLNFLKCMEEGNNENYQLYLDGKELSDNNFWLAYEYGQKRENRLRGKLCQDAKLIKKY